MEKPVPGIMCYFDSWSACKKHCSQEELGAIWFAVLEYAENGTVTEFDDRFLTGEYDRLCKDVDRAQAKYRETCSKRKLSGEYAAAVKLAKENGETPMDFIEYAALHAKESSNCYHVLSNASTCQQMIANSNSNHNSNHNSNQTVSEEIGVCANRGSAEGDKPPRASRFTPPSLTEVEQYCKERGNKVDAQRFVDFYTAKGWKIGKQSMKDWKAAVRTWERNDNGGKIGRAIPSGKDYLEGWEGLEGLI